MIQGRPTVCHDSTARQPSLGHRSHQPSTSLALRFSLHRGVQRISRPAHRADLKVVAQTDSHAVGTPQLVPKPSHRKGGERPGRSVPSISREGQPKGEEQHKTAHQPPSNEKIEDWERLLEQLKRGTQRAQCDAQRVKSVVAQLKQVAATLQPRDLAGLSQKAGKVAKATRSRDVKLLILEVLDAVVLRSTELGAQSFNVIDLTQMLSGFVHAEHEVSPEFVDGIAHALLEQQHRMQPRAWANNAWNFAKLGMNPLEGAYFDAVVEASLTQHMRDFTPHDIGNILWAFAKFNLTPANGSFLNSMAEAALGKLHKFKPQDFGNTLWALAKLNHTPANGCFLDNMVDAALGKLHELKPQDISNILWALATLDHVPANEHFFDAIATHVHLLSNSGKMFTIEHLACLYQAHLVFHKLNNASCSSVRLSDDIVTQAADAFHKQKSFKISKSQRALYNVLKHMGLTCMLKAKLDGHVMTVDIAIKGQHKIAVEFGGPYYYTSNQPFSELGSMRLRNKLLALDGWQVVMVPYFEWDKLCSRHDQIGYLQRKLEDVISS